MWDEPIRPGWPDHGGIAVSGEITLHKDYTGGANRWMKWERLADLDNVAECMKGAIEAINPPYLAPFTL